jgi:5'-methylthioadenosine phosphorylase
MKFSIVPRSIPENVEDRRKLAFVLPEYFGDSDGDAVENPA